jgi:2-polyprenyl-6-methoxyphenol hydroxylase-like FAD-dependent oxidoreductase
MRILIVGGGIAGLTLATLLRNSGMELVLIEAESAWSYQGYGIALWPMGSRILDRAGLYEAFVRRAAPINRYRIVNRKGRVLRDYDLRRLFGDREHLHMIVRRELIELLANSLARADVRMSTSAQEIVQTADKVEVVLSSGEREAFDLVVGCDGIHSCTREQIFGPRTLRSTGWGGWAWWTDPSAARQSAITEYWTPGLFFGLYPAARNLFCFLGVPNSQLGPDPAHPGWDWIRTKLEPLERGAHRDLAAPIPGQRTFYWDFSDLGMEQWHKGRVLLIGDASNAILPTAGVGASSAMESAAVLADELLHAGPGDIPRMCETVTLRHRHRARELQEGSRQMASLMFLESPFLTFVRDAALKRLPVALELKRFSHALREPV